MNRTRFTSTAVLVLVAGALLWPADASAIPAFARAHKLSCTTCHAPFPRLKPFGEDFAANGFALPDGTPIPDQEAPDPLLGAWLVEHHRTVFAADPEAEIPPDLAPALETFFENNAHARAVVPVRSGDELVALIVVPRDGARVRGPGLAFLERIADRLAEALIHARMAVRAAERERQR